MHDCRMRVAPSYSRWYRILQWLPIQSKIDKAFVEIQRGVTSNICNQMKRKTMKINCLMLGPSKFSRTLYNLGPSLAHQCTRFEVLVRWHMTKNKFQNFIWQIVYRCHCFVHVKIANLKENRRTKFG